jgi:uncharacterized membrane protein YccC
MSKKQDEPAAEAPKALALVTHPRASESIVRTRSVGALGSAAFVFFLTHTAGLPLFDCLLRALTAGIVGYFVAWFVAVTVWRQLIRAEIRAAIIRRASAPVDQADA